MIYYICICRNNIDIQIYSIFYLFIHADATGLWYMDPYPIYRSNQGPGPWPARGFGQAKLVEMIAPTTAGCQNTKNMGDTNCRTCAQGIFRRWMVWMVISCDFLMGFRVSSARKAKEALQPDASYWDDHSNLAAGCEGVFFLTVGSPIP